MNENDMIEAPAQDGVIEMAGLLSLLTNGGGVGFGVKALDGAYRLANQAMEHLLGQAAGKMTGKSESELLPAALLAPLARCDQRILDGAAAASEEIELSVNSQPVRCLWLKLPVLGPDKKLQAIASIIYDKSPANGTAHDTLERLRKTNRELQQTVVALEEVASTDKLTGAWNRRRLEECVRQEMGRFRRYKHPLSMLIVDIDSFKAINDRFGHGIGDRVLQALSALLQAGLRGTDSLARWGGEEFVVLCPDTSRATAAMIAERLRARTAASRFPDVGQLTISIGVAECQAGEVWDEWFQRADEALYRAKAGGRNQVQLAPASSGPEGVEDSPVANFVELVWRSAYECGNEEIDRGHRQLFSDANELLSAILSGQSDDQVGAIVDKLLADVGQHFREEEAIFVAAGFPGAAAHKFLHQQLIAQALSMGADYRAGKHAVGDVFQFLAHEVITKHMLGADRLFFDHIRRGAPPGG